MTASATGREVRHQLAPVSVECERDSGSRGQGSGSDGQVPGPVLRGKVGDTFAIELRNLPEVTSSHWHGLRVPAAMDGTELVQKPVRPGRSFQYRFLLPDAATFWCHPHTNETEQLENGLYGASIVRGPDEPVLDRERVLMLDDVKLDKRGRLAPFGGLRGKHDGRFGNVRLTKGRADLVLDVAAGQVERWRLVNTSTRRRTCRGKTLSTCLDRALCASRGCLTIVPAVGCITATSLSTMRRG
ncbi:Multicopper oxidase [Nocardioides terrae]|uniref:Multicopper oxidase n=1 Tax=Nocardioides terrae TaxID=574651 RepID=A0A1I1NI70_9ACTN|nr:Multicopper oxidase [Nocardioides terrae]